jgi:hypothetical protein
MRKFELQSSQDKPMSNDASTLKIEGRGISPTQCDS